MLFKMVSVLALMAVTATGVQTYRLQSAQATLEAIQEQSRAVKAEAKAQAERVEALQAEAERVAAEQYALGVQDAKDKYEAILDGLRSGAMQLREEWRGCQNSLSETTDSARRANADLAALRAAGAADIVRVGAECDAEIRAWQAWASGIRASR